MSAGPEFHGEGWTQDRHHVVGWNPEPGTRPPCPPPHHPKQAASLALLLVCKAQRRLITHCVYDEAERLFGKTATLIPSSPQGPFRCFSSTMRCVARQLSLPHPAPHTLHQWPRSFPRHAHTHHPPASPVLPSGGNLLQPQTAMGKY